MARSERVERLIANWHVAEAIVKRAEASTVALRGYDKKYSRDEMNREHAAAEAKAAAAMASELLGRSSDDG